MTRKQRNNCLLQIRRNWRQRAKFTAVYLDRGLLKTVAVANPMEANEENLVGVFDGEIAAEDFQEAVS